MTDNQAPASDSVRIFTNLLVLFGSEPTQNPRLKDALDQFSYSLKMNEEEYKLSKGMVSLRAMMGGASLKAPAASPERENATFNELGTLVSFAHTFGGVTPEKKVALQQFASQADISPEKFERALAYMIDQLEQRKSQLVQANQQVYSQTVAQLRQSGKTDAQIATTLLEVIKSKNLKVEFSADPSLQKAFYFFVWLIFGRVALLHKNTMVTAPMQLDLISSGKDTLDELVALLVGTEKLATDSAVLANVAQLPLEAIISDLSRRSPFAA